jgi:hypothetical protein
MTTSHAVRVICKSTCKVVSTRSERLVRVHGCCIPVLCECVDMEFHPLEVHKLNFLPPRGNQQAVSVDTTEFIVETNLIRTTCSSCIMAMSV